MNFQEHHETTFLIPNLHCPTCISHIQEALSTLRPAPVSISTSIISHTITVIHDASLLVPRISKALDDAAFEVFDVLSSSPVDGSEDGRLANELNSISTAFERAKQRWRSESTETDGEKKRRHIEHCDMCRWQSPTNLTGDEKCPSLVTDFKVDEITSVSVVPSISVPTFTVTLAVDGMTCASCVSNVTQALEGVPKVQSVNVNLLNNAAVITILGKECIDQLIRAVEDSGFDAKLQHVETSHVENLHFQSNISNEVQPRPWLAQYSIQGMTCSSCLNSIRNALTELDWIRSVDVSLLTNTASIVFEGDGRTRAREIELKIGDAGFDAQLTHLVEQGPKVKENSRRSLLLFIGGMYCEHCPMKIATALDLLCGDVKIEKTNSVRDPILEISYQPIPPTFTVRNILQALSDADEAFEPSIHQPLSLEERSRRVQRREQWRMFYRFTLSVIAAIPSFVIGIVYMDLVAKSNKNRVFLEGLISGVSRAEWSLLIIATPVYFLAADIFHRRTLKELRALWRFRSSVPILKRFYRFGSMNMLISFGTTVAYVASVVQVAIRASHQNSDGDITKANSTYFDSVVFLTMFLLLGRLIEAHSKAKTGSAVVELGKLRPSHAQLLCGTGVKQIPTEMLELGDLVRIPFGASPPCDGILTQGQSIKFDESSLTGESKLVPKTTGDKVFAGTINGGGPATMRLTEIAGNSMLDQIINVVREGQAKRAPVERIADTITAYFVPLVTLIAISTWILWLVLGISGVLPRDYLDTSYGGWSYWALEFAIAVFVVACPCGIGLASPTALFVGGGLAAQHGILVKGGGEAFQEASDLDCIVFDKTGTLTEGGDLKITDFSTCSDELKGLKLDETSILGMMAAVESLSTHPIAKSLTEFGRRTMNTFEVSNATETPGKGIYAQCKKDNGTLYEVIIGNESFVQSHEVAISFATTEMLNLWKSQAKSICLLGIKYASQNWQLVAAFAVADPPRANARFVIEELQKYGLDVWMLSGDNPITANAIGEQVGLSKSNIISGVLPSQKAEKIKFLQQSLPKKRKTSSWSSLFPPRSSKHIARRRATIAMVGDGINDSPALTSADVGIAIGSGSDVAISSAAFILVTSDLMSILTLIRLSQTVFQRIKINFGWALVYNCIALPIAAGVLYPVKNDAGNHIRLDPVWASLAMALSSISVVCSSLLLRTKLPVVGFRAK